MGLVDFKGSSLSVDYSLSLTGSENATGERWAGGYQFGSEISSKRHRNTENTEECSMAGVTYLP